MGHIEGHVTGPLKETGETLPRPTFSDNVTLGSMVETMVSWMTVKFGLEAPWDILNSISLSALELKYTFNKKDKSRNTVAFSVNIGPIDLGIMRIDSIDLNYATGKPNKKDNGVQVSLTGSFPWQRRGPSAGRHEQAGPCGMPASPDRHRLLPVAATSTSICGCSHWAST